MKLAALAFLIIVLPCACGQRSTSPPPSPPPPPPPPPPGGGCQPGACDWTQFGWDVGRSNAATATSGITAANLASLVRQQVTIDGTVDASAIYLGGVQVNGGTHDVFFVTTSYGKTLAVDAANGTVLWRFTPPNYASWAGSAQVMTATPVADPNRQFIYAAAPDGLIRKLAVADGSVAWGTPITQLPGREKIASALNYFHGRVIAVTDGYIGDAPPYQGHVAILDGATGNVVSAWNSLCSNRAGLIAPSSCAQSGSGIWGRGGAVIDSATGHIFVATGNGLWDGSTNWGDAVLEVDSLATQLLANYTPTNTATLSSTDTDLGSTSPILLGGGLVAQGGKDGLIRLLSLGSIAGTTPHQGGEQQVVSTSSGTLEFSSAAVLESGTTTWVFAADGGGTAAWQLVAGQLQPAWNTQNAGTSPVVVDGLLYVYDPGGGLLVYQANTGTLITTLPCGSGHWSSPIVTDGRIALAEGNSNSHSTSGVLDIWRLP